MSKLSKIFGGKDDDEQADDQADEATQAAAQPEGDDTHPPAAMPDDASAAEAPGDAPSTYSSIEEYEETLPKPDALS